MADGQPGNITAIRAWPRGLHAFEAVVLVDVALVVLLLRSHGLRLGWETVAYSLEPLAPAVARMIVWGIFLHAAYVLATRGDLRSYLRTVRSASWLGVTLRTWVALSILWYAYVWLKVSIPLLREVVFDRLLARVDTWLHFGISPTPFFLELFRGTPLVGFLDWFYDQWIFLSASLTTFFAASADPRRRSAFLFGTVLLWVLGSWLYLAVPALGPVYAFPAEWEGVRHETPYAVEVQGWLWVNYQKAIVGRATGVLPSLNPAFGIAAMPSLHVGVFWYLMLWARRAARPLFVPLVVGTFLVVLGSIVTGWHYAIDGYAGIALAQLCYWSSTALERRQGQAEITRSVGESSGLGRAAPSESLPNVPSPPAPSSTAR